MIFNRDDDLRGCTVRLRYMEPGESLTIPADASRYMRSCYVEYCFVGAPDTAFQHIRGSGAESVKDIEDIVEVLSRPEPETRKPSNKEPTVDEWATAWETLRDAVLHEDGGLRVNDVLDIMDSLDPRP